MSFFQSTRQWLPDDKFWRWYDAYLGSPQWAAKRKAVIDRAGGRCETFLCFRLGYAVHHEDYKTVGNEDIKRLKYKCRFHHAVAHRRWAAAAFWWIWDFRRR